MYESQHYAELPDTAGYDHDSPPAAMLLRSQSSLSNANTTGANVDRELYNDLVQMVPLVQSLIDRAGKSSFTHRGSMVYTKTPSRESLYRKTIDPKARNAVQSIPVKKRRDKTDKNGAKNCINNQDEMSANLFTSSRTLSIDQDMEELIALREQVKELQNTLIEKDELLKSAEIYKTQINTIRAELQELKLQAAEKDSLIKSTQSQLSDAKIKLADKQAAVEKLQWEAMTSNNKVEKLQEDLGSMQGDISSFMHLFEGLAKNTPTMSFEDYDVKPHALDHLPHTDDWEEVEIQKMEAARLNYISAVAVAKEKRDEDSISAATNARLYLYSFISRSNRPNLNRETRDV